MKKKLKIQMNGRSYNCGENNPMYGKKRLEHSKLMTLNNPSKRPEVRKKLSEKLRGENNPMFGKHHSEKIRKQIGIKLRGIKNPMYNLGYLIEGKNNPMFGKKHSIKSKIKQRIKALDRISKNNSIIVMPNIGMNEQKILDDLEEIFKEKIIRQYRILQLGLFVDGYIKSLNLCIEVDERKHFDIYGNLKQKDINRQKEIENNLCCKFLRIKEEEYLQCNLQ